MNNEKKQIIQDVNLISHCGFYCGACSKYLQGQCKGCRGNDPLCGTGFSKCTVKPCCEKNGYFSCADCTRFPFPERCKKFTPFSIRFAETLSCTSRQKGLEFIRSNGPDSFVKYMTEREWVTVKTKNNILNRKLGKRKE